jgi:CubicO group peptidase (beta-lactamase class C family)
MSSADPPFPGARRVCGGALSPQAGGAQRAALALAGLGIVAVAVLALLWRGYGRGGEQAAPLPSADDHAPRELVPGGNQPLAPRVVPELEQLERAGLEAAALYAGEHDSQALIVSRHDHIVLERYWHGTSFDTLADAQSLTPLLAALAAGVAVSHRLIAWPDEPVGAFISEWSQDPRGAITVRNLMQMSSGLAPPPPGRPASDIVAAALQAPLSGSPGGRRLEQAADPQLLALVIERATHQRYASYLSQALWRRIGAADAWLRLDRAAGAAHADCCMRAHQGDWIRIGQLLVRDGNYRGEEVMRPGWVALMRAPSKADPQYGAYLRLVAGAPAREPYAERDVFAVGGPGGNRLWLVPALQIAILCTGAPRGRDPEFNESRIPNLIMRAARDYRPPLAQPAADVSALVPGH